MRAPAGRAAIGRSSSSGRTRAVFVLGFAKSDRENIADDDDRDLKKLAKLTLGFTDDDMDRLVAAGKFDEVMCDDEGPGQDLPQRDRGSRA